MKTKLDHEPLDLSHRSLTVAVELKELRTATGGALDEEARKAMLEESRRGAALKLTARIRSFLQYDTPIPLPKRLRGRANANFVRFDPSQLAAFAKSFEGQLFLRDHNQWEMSAVGGRIVESEAVASAGRTEFYQSLELVKPWAIEDALDGTMSTFSIGWRPKLSGRAGYRASWLCSVCQQPMLSFDCPHFPGQELSPGGDGAPANLEGPVIVESLWRDVQGAETSEVAFPAVRGTGVHDIRAALSEARRTWSTPTSGERPMDDILKALGLSAQADETAATKAIAALRQDATDAKAEAEKERAARLAAEAEKKTAEDALAAERVKSAADRKAAHDAEVKRLHEGAVSKGLMIAGDEREKFFQGCAERSVKEAEAYLGTLSPIVPVGQPSQAGRSVDPERRPENDPITKAEVKAAMATGRFKDEAEYRKFALAEEN